MNKFLESTASQAVVLPTSAVVGAGISTGVKIGLGFAATLVMSLIVLIIAVVFGCLYHYKRRYANITDLL